MKAAVFFGGGAFIALHAGYCKGALANVSPDRVYGVSAGSLWATLLGFFDTTTAIQILSDIKETGDIFHAKDAIEDVGDVVGRAWPGLQFDYKPLEALINMVIVGNPRIPVTVSRVNLDTARHQHVTAYPDGTFGTDDDSLGKIETIQDFRDALLCSCLTAPLVDAFIDKTGKGWVDGGFREGGPVRQALADRADELHICLTGPYMEDVNFGGNAKDPLSMTTRLMLIMANQNILSAVDLALEHASDGDKVGTNSFIYQAQGQGDSMNFNQNDIQANIRIGQTVVAIPLEKVKEID